MEKERVFSLEINKKASFDGKSYIVRLPAELVHFLEGKNIEIDQMTLKGIWNLEDESYGVLMIFKNKNGEKKESYDEKDFVVLE